MRIPRGCDLRVCGQAAQLSAWEVRHPTRGLIFNLLMIAGLIVLGCKLFQKKEIKLRKISTENI